MIGVGWWEKRKKDWITDYGLRTPNEGINQRNQKCLGSYRMRAPYTPWLYIYYPIFKSHFFVFKEVSLSCISSPWIGWYLFSYSANPTSINHYIYTFLYFLFYTSFAKRKSYQISLINYLDVDYPFKLLKAIGNPVSSKRFENHYDAAGRCNMNAIAAKAYTPLTTEINKSLKKRSQVMRFRSDTICDPAPCYVLFYFGNGVNYPSGHW